MATTIDILLNIKSAGASILSQLQGEVNSLKTTLESLRSTKYGTEFEDSFKKVEAAATKAGTSVESLKAAVKSSGESASYLKGLAEGFSTLDSEALRATTTTAGFQKALTGGGTQSAWALGILDSLKQTSVQAEEARTKLELINGVKTSDVKSGFDDLSSKLKEGLGAGPAAAEVKKLAESLNEVKPAPIQNLGTAFNGLSGIIRMAATAFAGLKIAEYIKDATLGAARTEVLGTVLNKMANNAGITSTEINKVDKSVQKMGITAEASRDALANMIRSGLDVGKYSAALARASQDLAVVTGENSSDTLKRLITNISQLDTMGLRFMGITLDVQGAEEKYAASIGKTSAQLTQKQKIEAVTIGVLQESTKMTGLYEASMTNAGKALTSLPRYTKELADSLGSLFLPALMEVIKGVTLFLTSSKDFVNGLDGAKEAGAALGDRIHIVVGVLGDLFTVVATGAKFIFELGSSLSGLSTVIGTGAGMAVFGALILGVVDSLGKIPVLLSSIAKYTGLAALFEGMAAGMAGMSIAAAALTATGILALLAGVGVLVYKAAGAYVDMKKAQEDLAHSQAGFAKELASVPQSAMDAWHDFGTTLKSVSVKGGESFDELKTKGDELISAMSAGQKEYAAAYSKVAAGQGTKEQIKLVEEWAGKQKLATEAAKAIGKALLEQQPAAAQAASAFDKATTAAVALRTGFKDAADYAKYFWTELNKLNTLSFDGMKASAESAHNLLKAELNVNPEVNWDKAIQEDQRYYQQVKQMAMDNRSNRLDLLDAEFSDLQTNLEQRVAAGKKSGKDVLADEKELSQMKQEIGTRSIDIEKDALAQVTSARDQAHQAYVSSMQKELELKRQIAQEGMSYEMEMFNLSTQLANDGFAVKEKAIAERERALSQNKALSSQQREAEQQSIAADRNALTAEKVAHEAQVKTMIASKFSELMAEARAKLAANDLDGAKLAVDAAKGLEGSLGTVAEKMKAVSDVHKVNQEMLIEKQKRQQEETKKQEAAFESLKSVVITLTNALNEMVFSMQKTAMESHLLQMTSDLNAKTKDLTDSTKELAAQNKALEDARSKGDTSGVDTANAKIKDLTAQIKDQKTAVDGATKAYNDYKDAIANLKGPKEIVDPAKIKEADDKIKGVNRSLDELGKKDTKIGLSVGELNAADAQRAVDRFKRNNPDYKIPVKAETTDFENGVKKVKEAQGSITKTWVIPVTTQVDESQVTALTRDLEAQAAGTTIGVKVEADTSEATQAIDDLAQPSDPVEVTVTANDDAAQKDITSLDNEEVEVAVGFTPDTGAVDKATQAIDATTATPEAVFSADDGDVVRAKQRAEQPTSSVHTIYVRQVQQNANGGYMNHLAEGGVPTRAMNSVTGAGNGTSDSIFSMLSHGEFVLKAAAVQHYGLEQLYAMNNMLWRPQPLMLAAGGAVSTSRPMQSIATALSGSVKSAARDSIDLNFNVGGKKHTVKSSRETAATLVTAFRELSRAG